MAIYSRGGNMLEKTVKETIKKYELIQNGDTIIIGVSGGPDSMALLNVFIELQRNLGLSYQIVVAHINHMIREEAEAETKYVEQFCKQKQIPCYIKRVQVKEIAKEEKMGTEEAGRKVRYDFFEEVAQTVGGTKIATAHNANDNAETVLMNLMRGSGITGLKGIEPVRNQKFIRPFIECVREDIEKYCEEKGLDPKYDLTNQENKYTRNKIRNQLIPYLKKEFNPNIIETINRLSQLVTSENQYIDSVVEKAFQKLVIIENTKDLGKQGIEGKNCIILNWKMFNKQDKVIKSRLIRYTINRLLGSAKDIEKVHIEDILRLCENNVGNKYLVPNKKVKVMVNKGKIFFIRQDNGKDVLP